ncbi:aminotransferase class III-fold pyridoxal phosphate-dependent enzyme [Acuticoccus sp. MNP-M23]|uniref:aspartate aminotransferase family protein n=1 Tax=Acuticoccus sp. MNP-M23 TaxID=3072793 RepID=UPI0028159F36|nr:aminotransferase class III-fold pyridoxal phosphate-dependent enzyme [Acuticoccus sp. MNP-M23]WMS43937.1 aminotransferase class III-fold pyridoxal phosphate-dependent enzyme [Acuticoccus sp. MNP-M23]
MALDAQTNSTIVAEFRDRTRRSAAQAEAAREVFPSGITHDARHMLPYPLTVDQGRGSRKWDIDGNEYVDYFGGHGALLLGHGNPRVTAAIKEALDDGTQFAASTTREYRWGKAVIDMVPSVERVRFTASGTEATLLALRLARAFTGRTKLLRFASYFHGWHDHMTHGYTSHFDGTPTAGVLQSIADDVVLVAPNDTEAVRAALAGGDVAAIIVEPTGASFGRVPIADGVLAALREAATETGTVLIFDEVISGFRVARGGAQEASGVTPDLTTMAKIVAGGLPGGAVGGRADIMERLDFEAAADKSFEKIGHPGTFNANPVSAAAGIAALDIIANGDACDRANAYAAELREKLNRLFAAKGAPFAAYGTYSGFHIFLNVEKRTIDPLAFDPFALPWKELKAAPSALVDRLRMAMIINGVDLSGWPGGLASATHDADDMAVTMKAFEAAIARMKEEPDL